MSSSKDYKTSKNTVDSILKELESEHITESDNVNHPAHYMGNIEVIDYIEDKLSTDQFEGYLVGNILKYLSRYQKKNGLEDLEKGQWYLNKLIKVKKNE